MVDILLAAQTTSFCFYSNLALQWGAADAENKVPSGENTELNILPLKPGVGQYIVIRAMLTQVTARDCFLAYFYPSGPFTCIFFPKPHPIFFLLCWLWLTPVPV